MNKTKSSNPVRLIAFFLTAFLLICTFGFTADGWQIGEGDGGGGESNMPSGAPSENPDTEQDPSDSEGDEVPEEPEIYIPQFVNRISGVEVSEEMAAKAHLAFVMNPTLPSYGISGADLICELPTEDGGVRMVAFIPDSERLWKIGSLTYTRGYISNIVKYFGGMCVSGGSDDSINYNQCDIKGTHLDLSLNGRYHYTEFTSNIYTNSDLLSSGIKDSGLDIGSIPPPTLPYNFTDFGSEPIVYGDGVAKKIRINQSDVAFTELCYNNETGKYSLLKNGTTLTDAINGKQPEFENCFALFADSVTYDNTQCSQMVMDTIGGGSGYYFTRGGVCEIKWSGTADGVMTFSLPDGERLTVNRGSVYISFLKSSMIDKISFE